MEAVRERICAAVELLPNGDRYEFVAGEWFIIDFSHIAKLTGERIKIVETFCILGKKASVRADIIVSETGAAKVHSL